MSGKPGTHASESPASSSGLSPSASVTSRARARSSKREQVVAACYECRSKKVKCDATRPSCGRCSSRGLTCYYDVAPETSRAVALKRKHENVQDDLDRMTELYEYIRSRSEGEIAEIVSQIRQTADPFAVLKHLRDRDGDLVSQRALLKPNIKAIHRDLDAAALQESRLKVRAGRWTSVAGDGIVSHLLSIALFPAFTAFIDEEALITDMSVQSPGKTPYCSPLLINMLCAIGTVESSYAERLDDCTNGMKLHERFLNEALEHFANEKGRASLQTVQASFLLYLYWTFQGMDRAGLLYRSQGVEMFKKLKLGTHLLPCEPGYSEAVHRRACSRNAWGLFCLESFISYTYLQPSTIPIPTLPLHFMELARYDRTEFAMIRTSEDVLEAKCHLMSIFFRIASYKPREPSLLGTYADISSRQRLYDALRGWYSVVPARPHYGPPQAVHHRVFKAYFHIFSAILWRPLQDIAVCLESGQTPAEVCILHCTNALNEHDANMHEFPETVTRGTPSILWSCHMLAFTLITMLRRHRDSEEPLVRVIRLLYTLSKKWLNARVLLRALYAISLQLRVELPEEARQHCRGTDMDESVYLDMPTSYTVPRHADFDAELGGQDDGSDEGVEVGDLIAKWAALATRNG